MTVPPTGATLAERCGDVAARREPAGGPRPTRPRQQSRPVPTGTADTMGIEVSIGHPGSAPGGLGTTWPTWASNVRVDGRTPSSITFVSPATQGVGTTYDCVTKIGPLRTTDRMEIVEWDPPHALGVRAQRRRTRRRTVSPSRPSRRAHVFTWSEDLTLPWYFGRTRRTPAPPRWCLSASGDGTCARCGHESSNASRARPAHEPGPPARDGARLRSACLRAVCDPGQPARGAT